MSERQSELIRKNNNLQRLMNKSIKNGECIEYTGGISSNGYGVFWLNGRSENAHKASYSLHKGKINVGEWVLHTCDNKKCINPLHLYLGDHHQNTLDAVNRGRMASGIRHGSKTNPASRKRINAKFNDDDCLKIKNSSLSVSELSKIYNVHFATIYRAKYHADALLNALSK